MAAKGLSLESLHRLGVQQPPLSGDALIEAALKEAGCNANEIYECQTDQTKQSHTTALAELETKAAAYKALLERTDPPATQQELDAAKIAYETALTAFQTATKTGPTFNTNDLPDALKTRYNTATASVTTADSTRTARIQAETRTRQAQVQQENRNANYKIEQLKTNPLPANAINLQAISYNLPANQVVLTIHTANQGDVLVLAEKQGNGYKIITQSLANGQVVLNSQGQPTEIRVQQGAGLLEWVVRDTHYPITQVTQRTARPAPDQTPGTSTTPRPTPRPIGLNANGQRIWQQLSDREIAVSQANVRRINDGTISKDDAVALGLVSQADQAGVFTAYNKTDTDQVWDTNELGRYLDVVKTVSERSGRPIGEVLETFRNTRYLVTVNFDQIGTTLSGIGTAGWTGVVLGNPPTPEERLAAANTVAGNLSTKVETKVLEEIKKRVAAGTIANQSQLEQYLFNAMMGSMTGICADWGVPELQGIVSAFKPRSAEQTGEDLTTWIRTGKSPDASATGTQEGEGYRRAMTALQERGRTYNDAIAIYNTGEHASVLKGNPQAIDYIVDLAIKEGKYTELITFLNGQTLTAEQKRDIYRKIVEKQTQKIQDMLGASPPNISGAKTELESLKALVTAMGTEGTGHQGQIHSITLTIAGQLAQRNTGTDRADAYALIDAIPPEAEFNHGRDQNAVVIHGRLEARFFLASSIKDKQPMTNFLANQPAGTTATQRGYAQYYLAKAGESPRTKQELEATLEIYKKSAEFYWRFEWI
ncbi:MAG: hypothetical protein KKD13_00505 [Candidatus Margulisbacteria bacterium]|nr:hypothetical protein [Candidatus Margulisiibacteriota bacterium]